MDTLNPYWVECWNTGDREEFPQYCFSLQEAVKIAWEKAGKFEMVQIRNPESVVEYSPETIQEAFEKYMTILPSRPKSNARAILRVIK